MYFNGSAIYAPANDEADNIAHKQAVELEIGLFACILHFLFTLFSYNRFLSLVELIVASLNFFSQKLAELEGDVHYCPTYWTLQKSPKKLHKYSITCVFLSN